MTSRRIYFITSDYDTAEEPTNKLCYWEPRAGIVEVSTNIAFDLGTGYITRDSQGNVIVSGPRWGKHRGPVKEFGDYWYGDTGYENLTEDVLLYRLDKDLQNPEVLTVDGVSQSSSEPGWRAQWLHRPSSTLDDQQNVPHLDPDRGIVLLGRRVMPWSDADQSEGTMVHTYTESGELVKRELPRNGWWIWQGYPDGFTNGVEGRASWSTYDRTRGLAYMHDTGGLWRFNMATGETTYAPAVFPWVQTNGGYTYEEVPVGSPDSLVQGPYPNGRYSVIMEKDYWRSRRVEQMAVAQDTGHIWALVHGYEPYGQEYAMPGDGTPMSEHRGGDLAPGDEWQLLCVDPEALYWIDDFVNPFPRTGPRAGDYAKYYGPRTGPPQAQADVKTITLTRGVTMLSTPPVTWGDDADLGGALSWDGVCVAIPDDEPGVALFSIAVPQFDDALAGGEGADSLVYAVCQVDLETGRITEAFRDLRRRKPDPSSPDDPLTFVRHGIFQILPGDLPVLNGEQVDSRTRFIGA